MLPQVGAGRAGGECREDDGSTRRAACGHRARGEPHRASTPSGRSSPQLGGGCDLPVGAYATVEGDGTISLRVLIASLDGPVVLRESHEGADPIALGELAGSRLLAGARGAELLS